MKFVLSIHDSLFSSFNQRAIEAFGASEFFTRIQITPENLPVPKPSWWIGAEDRWAVTQALLQALKQAQSAGEDCEIYEEDCVFSETFEEVRSALLVNVPADWDMIYLGGQLLALNFYPLQEIEGNETVLLCKNAHRNHAWICRKESVSRVIDWLESPDWPCHQTCDWRLGYLHMQDDFHVYVPKSGWICGQGPGLSSLDHCEYPERWWHFTEPEKTQENERIQAFNASQKEAEERARFEAWRASFEVSSSSQTQDAQGSEPW